MKYKNFTIKFAGIDVNRMYRTECETVGTYWPTFTAAARYVLMCTRTQHEEREKVQEFVSWWMSQQTPTEVYAVAFQDMRPDWREGTENAPEWECDLFGQLEAGTHPRQALYDRYARMYAHSQWQEVAKGQWLDFMKQWHSLTQDKCLVIETLEILRGESDEWEGNRYFMVSYFPPRTAAECGYWAVTRCGNEYCPPEDNIGIATGTQAACRLTVSAHGTSVTLCQFVNRLINAGRVVDIYATNY